MIEGINEHSNKFGIEPVLVSVKFIPLLCMERYSEKKYTQALIRIKSFLVSQIKRGITATEERDMLNAVIKFYKADPGTNQRIQATNYLLKLKFLK